MGAEEPVGPAIEVGEIIQENLQSNNGTLREQEYRGKEYQPSRPELLRNYEINIQFLSIGCIIRVGCKTIPFTSIEEAMKELTEYISNPFDTTKKWNNILEEYK